MVEKSTYSVDTRTVKNETVEVEAVSRDRAMVLADKEVDSDPGETTIKSVRKKRRGE